MKVSVKNYERPQVRNHKRDLEILHMRHNQRMKFPEIAKKYGITKVRARQLYLRMVSERENKQLGIGE